MLWQLVISGLQSGAVYGLVGLGYATVLNATGIVNFAQGDFLMVAALVMAVLSALRGFPYVAAVLIALMAVSIIGLASDYLLIRPLRRKHASLFSMVMVMVGAMIVLEQGSALVFGKRELPVNSPVSTTPLLLGSQVYIQPQGLVLLAVVAVVFVLLYGFYHHTNQGKQMYAVGIDIGAARAIGINTVRANAWAFALGGMVAGIGGVLFAPIVGASWQMGLPLTIKGFVAMVVGGAARLEGPLLGGSVLGLAEVFAYSWISPAYGSALALIVLLVVLVLRPSGLLGDRR